MNVSTLKRQLVREFRASPAKAVALVALFFVGIYFWAPIIVQKLSKKPASVTAAATAPTTEAPAPLSIAPTTTAAPAKTEPGLPDWHDVAQWIQQDARMTAIAWSEGGRDPFETLRKPEPVAESKPVMKKIAPAKPKQIDPDDLDLVVSSIALGPGGRTALINGETYREGHTIELEDGLRVQLTRVMPKRVLFECQGQEFELAVAGGGSQAIKLRRP